MHGPQWKQVAILSWAIPSRDFNVLANLYCPSEINTYLLTYLGEIKNVYSHIKNYMLYFIHIIHD